MYQSQHATLAIVEKKNCVTRLIETQKIEARELQSQN